MRLKPYQTCNQKSTAHYFRWARYTRLADSRRKLSQATTIVSGPSSTSRPTTRSPSTWIKTQHHPPGALTRPRKLCSGRTGRTSTGALGLSATGAGGLAPGLREEVCFLSGVLLIWFSRWGRD